MKRLVSVLIFVSLAILLCPAVLAADGFYCEYTPKSEHSALFYIDVYSDKEICAATAKLSFDTNHADFRSVTAHADEDSVRFIQKENTVNIAFASKNPKSGLLFRTGFKAVSVGKCDFILSVDSAADSKLSLVNGFSPYTLTVTFGKDDITAQSGDSTASGRGSSSSGKTRGGNLSVISAADTDDDGAGDSAGTVIDIRPNPAFTYILLGAGGVFLLVLIAVTAFMINKRRKQQRAGKPSSDNIITDSDKQTITLDEQAARENAGEEAADEDL